MITAAPVAVLAVAVLAVAAVVWPGATHLADDRRAALIATGRLAVPAARPALRLPAQAPTVLLAVSAALIAVTWSLPAGVATVVAGLQGRRLVRRRLAERRALTRRSLVADAVGLVCDELEAGQLSGAALRAAADAQPVAAGPGAGLAEALRSVAGSQRSSGWAGELLDPVRAAWQVSEPTGAPLVTVLRRVHADLLDRATLHRERLQALAGPRASASLLAGLPVVGIALGQAVGAHPVSLLTGTQLGRALLAAGVLFDLAGLSWTDRLARS